LLGEHEDAMVIFWPRVPGETDAMRMPGDLLKEGDEVAARLWARKWLLAAAVLAGVVVAVIYLNLATYRYRAELRVTPSSSRPSALASAGSAGANLASLAGISLGAATTASPFDLYMDAFLSREVASDLARDPRIMHHVFASNWDSHSASWHPVTSVFSNLTTALKQILGGRPERWRRPDAAALQEYLLRSIQVYKGTTSPVTRIQYDDADPDFAAYLLSQMNTRADRKVRGDAIIQARSYLTYLTQRLATVALTELRSRIADQLSRQEELLMMASSSVPYAAVTLEPPSVPETPASPRQALALGAGVLAGMIGGTLVILMLPRRHYRRSAALEPTEISRAGEA
jgi:hypothetical protein